MNRKNIIGRRIEEKEGVIRRIVLILLMSLSIALLFSVSNVFAITGTSQNITMNAGFGAISADTSVSSITTRSISPWSTIGPYAGGSDTGIFGQRFEGQGSTITLITPQNNRIENGGVVQFVYNASNAADNCKLYIDGILKGINSNVNIGSNEFTMGGISATKHDWNISCTSSGITKWSSTQAFSMVILPYFNNMTDTTGINMYSVPNFTLEETNVAKVLFNGFTDLSNGGDMSTNVIFGWHTVTINSDALPMLNKSATITMYDVNYTSPIIWRNGAQCIDCTLNSLNSQILVFTVTGFSTYTVTASTTLKVWDDTDTIITRPDTNITVYANYTNAVTGAPISSADGQCTISVNDDGWSAPIAMTYDGASGRYQYITLFNSSGVRP
jgi:hypothetical protein